MRLPAHTTSKHRNPTIGRAFPDLLYRGTSLMRMRTPLGPYRRPMRRVLGGSYGGGRFLMGEAPLCRPNTRQKYMGLATCSYGSHRGTWLKRNRPPPSDHHRSLRIFLP